MNAPTDSADTTRKFRAALLEYYDRNAREMPWRSESDPYRILVSEVMLQQTRVDTVKPFYERWVVQFPTLESLALADEDAVLKAWEGLGYYRRARNLRRAALTVREKWDGELPQDREGLRTLPGVGAYTSGAIASIAFGEAVPAVDGNVRRVLARLYDEPRPTPAWLESHAQALVDERRPGDWNQALMELGATLCAPKKPRCDRCPVAVWCRALGAGSVESRPEPAKRAPPRAEQYRLAVLYHEGEVLVERRPSDGLLGGLWALPEARDVDSDRTADAWITTLAESIGLGRRGDPHPLPTVRHRFSHIDATYVPVALEVGGPTESVGSERKWIHLDGDAATAIPVAQQKVLACLREARATVQ